MFACHEISPTLFPKEAFVPKLMNWVEQSPQSAFWKHLEGRRVGTSQLIALKQ